VQILVLVEVVIAEVVKITVVEESDKLVKEAKRIDEGVRVVTRVKLNPHY